MTLRAFDDLDLTELRLRRSAKWHHHPADVLPAWVAEMDFPLAEPVREAVTTAVSRGDTGYGHAEGVAEAFAAFASRRYGWQPDPARTMPLADVMTGVLWSLRLLTRPGDPVVVDVPAYPPFFAGLGLLDRPLVPNPLVAEPGGWRLDLDGLERAFVAGARAYLLCNPHNPTGHVATPQELTRVAELAARHRVTVVVDEVHAPLTLPGATHTPYASSAAECPADGGDGAPPVVTLASASKAWNVPGLKCAVAVAADAPTWERLREVPEIVQHGIGQLGVVASIAAFTDGEAWLQECCEHLARQRDRLAALLAAELPEVVCRPWEAGYLAWLDCRALGLGEDPAATFLTHGRVALVPGPDFGEVGRGWARLNTATSGDLMAEAVRRMAAGAGWARSSQPSASPSPSSAL